MKTKLSIIFLFLIIIGCKKPMKEFTILPTNKSEKIKIYSDSTFVLTSGENKYCGNWKGNIANNENFSITTTSYNSKILTLTPTEYFRIKNSTLVRIKKNGRQKGWKLFDFINFDDIEKVKIRNKNGTRYLTKEETESIIPKIKNSTSVGGILSKPQWLYIVFEFKNGTKIGGSISANSIHFESKKIVGTFKLNEDIKLNEY